MRFFMFWVYVVLAGLWSSAVLVRTSEINHNPIIGLGLGLGGAVPVMWLAVRTALAPLKVEDGTIIKNRLASF